jgi:hypothetical protein
VLGYGEIQTAALGLSCLFVSGGRHVDGRRASSLNMEARGRTNATASDSVAKWQ